MSQIKRSIIKIDEEKCNGCGLCIPSCKEGALAIVDGKARLVSETYCDGLGACLGQCPQGALTIEEREASAFDEAAVEAKSVQGPALPCGCPGTMARSLPRKTEINSCKTEVKSGVSYKASIQSELRQWPIQLALIPENAPYLERADLVLLADCTAVAYANLHKDFIRGRIVAMACPKLDNTSEYSNKLARMIKFNNLRSIEVVIMEVPCCRGLSQIVHEAASLSGGNISIKETIVGVEGDIISV